MNGLRCPKRKEDPSFYLNKCHTATPTAPVIKAHIEE